MDIAKKLKGESHFKCNLEENLEVLSLKTPKQYTCNFHARSKSTLPLSGMSVKWLLRTPAEHRQAVSIAVARAPVSDISLAPVSC